MFRNIGLEAILSFYYHNTASSIGSLIASIVGVV